MNNHELSSVEEEKNLGVYITNDLKPSRNCIQAYSKAKKAFLMIRRTFTYKSKKIVLRLYKTLVQTHLEYCSPMWGPYYTKDKDLIE